MQTRQVIALVVVIAVIALALGITIGYSLTSGRTTRHTVTGCCTSDLYKVEFIQQAGTCPPSIPMYVAPWSVTLGNQTKVQPPNATTSSSEGWSTSNSVYSEIVFLVTDGIYNFTANPYPYTGYTPFLVSSGTVSVSGSNVTVKVGPPEVYCTAATTTQTIP